MAPPAEFTLNALQRSVPDRDQRELTEKALLDALGSVVTKLDNSGILDKDDIARMDSAQASEHLPMNRSLTYSWPVDRSQVREEELKKILEVEQDLADYTLAMMNNDNIATLLEKIGFPDNDTTNQKFRKHALKRVALRQLLTESTDAMLRMYGFLQPSEHHRKQPMPMAFANNWGQYFTLRVRAESKYNSRKSKWQNIGLLEELFEVTKSLNDIELGLLETMTHYPADGLEEWFERRAQRLGVAFMSQDLVTAAGRMSEQVRLLEALRRLMRFKDPQPDWWPLPPKEVAQNSWGASNM